MTFVGYTGIRVMSEGAKMGKAGFDIKNGDHLLEASVILCYIGATQPSASNVHALND